MNKAILCVVTVLVCLVGCKTDEKAGLQEDRTNKTIKAIQSSIDDPARAKKMVAVVEAFVKDVHGIETEIKELRAKAVEANADYGTSRADLEKIYARLGGEVTKLGDTLKARSLEVRKLCTAEEWKKITASNDDLIEFKF